MGILTVVIFGLTALCLLIWVRDPLRGLVRAIGAASKSRFDQRIVPRGAGELRLLANGLNEMIDALGRSQRERASEMQRARDIQLALTAGPSTAIRGFETQAVSFPAASVGGDLLDVVALDDGSVLVAMIDVTGHGVPGALCTALLRSAIRHLARATDDLAEIVNHHADAACFGLGFDFVEDVDALTAGYAGHKPLFHNRALLIFRLAHPQSHHP